MGSFVPVSVVVASFEEGDRLAGTIESVTRASVRPREVVVVDDGSTDGSCDREWPPGVRLVRAEHRGVAAARNDGARIASEPVLVFLDAHCVVDDGWLSPLVDALERAPDALVGPAVRDASDTRFAGCGAEIVDALLTYRWRPATAAGPVEVGLIPGGCLAVARDRFLAAGGFGPFTGLGLEDVDLGLRWWRSGHPSLGVPASVITHEFRTLPPYRPDTQAWLRNVLRTALVHLTGPRLEATVLACARFSAFPGAIASVLAEPWVRDRQRLLASEVRTVGTYLDRWAPAAFGP